MNCFIFRAYCVTSLGLALMTLLSCFIGLVIFSYFRFCDPITNGEIFTKDQVLLQTYKNFTMYGKGTCVNLLFSVGCIQAASKLI